MSLRIKTLSVTKGGMNAIEDTAKPFVKNVEKFQIGACGIHLNKSDVFAR
jgi:hypothetical protein